MEQDTISYFQYFYMQIVSNYFMSKPITCWQCNNIITQYYNKSYNGNRGRCLICDVDFPLD